MADSSIEKKWFLEAIERRIADITVERILTSRNKSQLTRLRLAKPNATVQIDQLEKQLDSTLKAQLDSIKALEDIKEKLKNGDKEIDGVEINE